MATAASVWLACLLFFFGSCGASRSNRSLLQDDKKPAPTSFAATVQRLDDFVDSSPYGEALTMDHTTQCLVHFMDIVLPTCFGKNFSFATVNGDILDKLVDIPSCCEALNASVDEGMCLCEPATWTGGLLELARPALSFASLCGAKFPIPSAQEELPSVLELDQCQEFVEASSRGAANPNAIGLTEEEFRSAKPDSLPKFKDIYEKPKGGVYTVKNSAVIVMRPSESTLINQYSNATHFVATLVFPGKRINGGKLSGKFPVVGFVPGFGASPATYERTIEYIASLGIIVVIPWSSYHLDIDFVKENVDDWAKDLVYAVRHVIRMGKERNSLLSGLPDRKRIGFVGHSMGGAVALVAAQLGKLEGLAVRSVVAVTPACVMIGSQCESPYNSISKLKAVKVLFIAASDDRVTPAKTSKIFRSWLPKETSSELIVMEGATHCFNELDPVWWPESIGGCGRGDMPPQEAIAKMQVSIRKFFKKTLLRKA